MSVKANNKKNVTKASKQTATKKVANVIVTDAVGNYEKHPFFIKKANAAKELLRKVGLPKDFKVNAS